MRLLATLIAALSAVALSVPQAAHAFTYENQGSSQSSAPQSGAKSGLVDLEPGALIPPISQKVEGSSMDFGPGAFNNGWASQPSRNESIGPSWLYPPR
jgi:hypothetical protein